MTNNKSKCPKRLEDAMCCNCIANLWATVSQKQSYPHLGTVFSVIYGPIQKIMTPLESGIKLLYFKQRRIFFLFLFFFTQFFMSWLRKKKFHKKKKNQILKIWVAHMILYIKKYLPYHFHYNWCNIGGENGTEKNAKNSKTHSPQKNNGPNDSKFYHEDGPLYI